MEPQVALGRKINTERFGNVRPRICSASSSLNNTHHRGAGTDRRWSVNDTLTSADNRLNAVSLVSMVDSAISSLSDFVEIVKSATEKKVSDVQSFFSEQKCEAQRRKETTHFNRHKLGGNETIAHGSFETDRPYLNMLESRLYQKRKGGIEQRLGNNPRYVKFNVNEGIREHPVSVRSSILSDETLKKESFNSHPPEILRQEYSNNNSKHKHVYDTNTEERHLIRRQGVLGRKDSFSHEKNAGFELLDSKDSNSERPPFEKRQCFENILSYADGKTLLRTHDILCVNNEVCFKRCVHALQEFQEHMCQISAEDYENAKVRHSSTRTIISQVGYEDERTYKDSPHAKRKLGTTIKTTSDLEMKYVMTKSYVFIKAMQPTCKNVSVLHIAVQYLLVPRRIKVTVEKVTNSNAARGFTTNTKSFMKLDMLLNDRMKAKKTKKQYTNGNDEIEFNQDLYFNNFTLADAHLVSLRLRLFRKKPNFLRGGTCVGEAVAFLDDVDIVGQAKFALPLIPFD